MEGVTCRNDLFFLIYERNISSKGDTNGGLCNIVYIKEIILERERKG
jgi:hypothetical protein